MEKFYRLKVDMDYPYYEGDYCEVSSVSLEEIDFEKILENSEFVYKLENKGFYKINLTKSGKINDNTSKILRKCGWANLNTAKNREEKKVLDQKYYIVDSLSTKNYYVYPKFNEIDIDDLTAAQLTQLAKGARIVQAVTPKSVLSAAQYKKLQEKRKSLADAAAKKKQAAEKKAVTKKAKQIEVAKKLLKEAGEITK